MPITVQYNPSFIEGGQLARDSGRGRFLQEESKFDYQRLDSDRRFGLAEDQFTEGQRQFDEGLAQKESQFGRSLQQNVNETALRDRQYNQGLYQRDRAQQRELGQRGEQFDAQLGQRQEELGFRRDMAGQELDQRQQALKAGQRSELLKIKQRKEDQRYDLALSARERLEEQFKSGKINEPQYMQAREQFMQKFGDIEAFGGQYPDAMNEKPFQDFDNDAFTSKFLEQGVASDGETKLFTQSDMEMYTETDENGESDWTEDGKVLFGQERARRDLMLWNRQKADKDISLEKQKYDTLVKQQEIDRDRKEDNRVRVRDEKQTLDGQKEQRVDSKKVVERTQKGFQDYIQKIHEWSIPDPLAMGEKPPRPDAMAFLPSVSAQGAMQLPEGSYFVMDGKVYQKMAGTKIQLKEPGN